MKLYVLDDNGVVVFESSIDADGERHLVTTKEINIKVTMLLKAALKFLQWKEK